MPLDREQLLRQANAVLDWNRRHLNATSVLSEAQVGECFAEHFVVEPNGRHYAASRADYLAFLNGMKAGMAGIDYDVDHALADGDAVTLSMRAHIAYGDGRREHFRAMLLMRFDADGKVVLWHEVYVPLPTAT
ncbi:MAG: nuclear transport factor 2 family protein [Stenotrophomonas sp.]